MKRLLVLNLVFCIAVSSQSVNITSRNCNQISPFYRHYSQKQDEHILDAYGCHSILCQFGDGVDRSDFARRNECNTLLLSPIYGLKTDAEAVFGSEQTDFKYASSNGRLQPFSQSFGTVIHATSMVASLKCYTEFDQTSSGFIRPKGLDFPAEPGEDMPLSSGNCVLFLGLSIYAVWCGIRLKKRENKNVIIVDK